MFICCCEAIVSVSVGVRMIYSFGDSRIAPVFFSASIQFISHGMWSVWVVKCSDPVRVFTAWVTPTARMRVNLFLMRKQFFPFILFLSFRLLPPDWYAAVAHYFLLSLSLLLLLVFFLSDFCSQHRRSIQIVRQCEFCLLIFWRSNDVLWNEFVSILKGPK